MKYVVILSFCLISSAFASYVPHTVVASPTHVNTGSSAQYRSQDNLGNYAFGYNENHATGGTFRRESGDSYGTKIGSYGLRDADGRVRVVNYVADAAGFRVAVASNEPGLTPQLHQAATINKPTVAVQAAPAIVAPVAINAPVADRTPIAYRISPLPIAHASNIHAEASYAHLNHEPLLSAHPGPVGHVLAGPLVHKLAYSAPIISKAASNVGHYFSPSNLHGYPSSYTSPLYEPNPIRR